MKTERRRKVPKMTEQERLRVAVKMTLEKDGLSMRGLAVQTGLYHADLSRMLAGRDARMSTWERIATALDTSLLELLAIPEKTILAWQSQRASQAARKTA